MEPPTTATVFAEAFGASLREDVAFETCAPDASEGLSSEHDIAGAPPEVGRGRSRSPHGGSEVSKFRGRPWPVYSGNAR